MVPFILAIASPKEGPPIIITLVVSISESTSKSLSRTEIILEIGSEPSIIIESSKAIGQSFS